MAIKKSFQNTSIYKPGAYSSTRVDNSNGAPIGTNDTVFLVGESTLGAPGATEGIVEFSAERMSDLVAKYGEGPIVDCAVAALRPSTTPGIGGAGRFLVYKTNATTQASLTLDSMITVKDRAWGLPGNDLSVTVENGSTSDQKIVTIKKLSATSEVLGENPARSIMTIQYTGNASTATLTISGASRSALVLATTLAGDQSDGSVNLSIALVGKTMKQLADQINAQTGYTAAISYVPTSANAATELDPITTPLDVKASAKTLKRLQFELVELFNTSTRVEATLVATPVEGIITNTADEFLTGGAKGASTNSSFSTGMSKSLAETYNILLPCISRDASEDIADVDQGFTDAASTYDIASVLAAASAHLTLRGSIKNRKEAQGMGGVRKSTKAAAFAAVSDVGSELMQVAIQDVEVLDATGTLTLKHPHVFAALCAGIRLGTTVGEPLTHKFLRVSRVGHFISPVTGLETGDFNSDLDVDEALLSGVMFAEKPAAGGFRIVADQTTYGADASFIFNRGSVVEAAQFTAKTLRETAELVFVGSKAKAGIATSIKSVLTAKLNELFDADILGSSSDAPRGYKEDSFVVSVVGDTATVQIHIKPITGLDFIFIDFEVGQISQTA